ncbi:MAG: hypothetical protein AB2A00_36720 [Myxococcota bacterium]
MSRSLTSSRPTSLRLIPGLVAACLALSLPTAAHAYSFRATSTLVSVQTGPRANVMRLDKGTRRTPASAMELGVSVETVLYAPQHLPHRWSLVLSVWPDLQGTWDAPTTGRRPGGSNPLPDPGVLKDLALGVGGSAEVRYRWETGMTLIPYVQAGLFTRAHKPLGVPPPHLNLGVRAGGGLEYFPLHRVGLFAGFHLQGGPLLFPVTSLVPQPELAAEGLVGVTVRVF